MRVTTSDLVLRLRSSDRPCVRSGQLAAGLCVECEAADEIERLMAVNDSLQRQLLDVVVR